jgi:hypothetical protein
MPLLPSPHMSGTLTCLSGLIFLNLKGRPFRAVSTPLSNSGGHGLESRPEIDYPEIFVVSLGF